MVIDAPPIAAKVGEFHQFLGEAVAVAHHAPFDLGFMAIEFEKQGLGLPSTPVLCTSLLSRAVIPESPNHRLQTLVNFLGIEGGQAHRALDDAIACLNLMFKCLDRLGKGKTVGEVFKAQGPQLIWRDFSLQNLRCNRVMEEVISALREQRLVEIIYRGGSRPGQPRTVMPLGLVRNPNGDFLVAREEKEGTDNSLEEIPKRYFLEKVTKARS